MSNTFTPGPWKAWFDFDGDHAIYGGSKLVAVTTGKPDIALDEDRANSDLIAAAPMMLELLEADESNDPRKEVQRWATKYSVSLSESPTTTTFELFQQARIAVIKKARG